MGNRRENAGMAGLVIGMALLIGTGFLAFFAIRNSYMAEQQRMIGKLYEKNPEVCAQILQDMFGESSSGEDVEKGREALISLGYTGEGVSYLYQHTGWNLVYGKAFLVQAGIAAALFCLFLYLQKKREKEEDALIQDIREARERGDRLEASKYSFCKGELAGEISKAMEMLHSKEKFLTEKNERTQAFIENIAHQIKTPLSCISLSMDLMLEKAEENQKERIMECFPYLDSIGALMKRLLDIGRLEAGKILMRREAVCIESLLEDCRNSLPGGEQKISICLEGREKSGEYYGDYEWLKEAILNILKNCLEHDKSGEKVQVSYAWTEEGVKIVIRDHGEGISEKDLPYIFDRFYIPEEIKSSHTGIGMNLAKLVAEKHFGSIKAMNREEGGAAFIVVLPVYGLKNGKL